MGAPVTIIVKYSFQFWKELLLSQDVMSLSMSVSHCLLQLFFSQNTPGGQCFLKFEILCCLCPDHDLFWNIIPLLFHNWCCFYSLITTLPPMGPTCKSCSNLYARRHFLYTGQFSCLSCGTNWGPEYITKPLICWSV